MSSRAKGARARYQTINLHLYLCVGMEKMEVDQALSTLKPDVGDYVV